MSLRPSAHESLLGVAPDASVEDVRIAYRRQLDRLAGEAGRAGEERFLQLRRAYDAVLRERATRTVARDRRSRAARVGGRVVLTLVLLALASVVVVTQLTDLRLLVTRHAPGTTLRLVGTPDPYGTVTAFDTAYAFHAGPPTRAYEIELHGTRERVWLTERIVENGMEPVGR